MPTILSATEVTLLYPISISAQTIIDRKYIEVVEERLPMLLNNYFTLDIYVQDELTFNATANSITLKSGTTFEQNGFRAGHIIYLYNSYENDQYCIIESLSGDTAILSSAYSVVDELSGRSILISAVKWPWEVKSVAAEMVYFDSDIRLKTAPNIRSRSLGPLSESFTTGDTDEYGYPREITGKLDKYRIARFM